ncbi:hypothetical protein LOTGIDRAFT_102899 [Lottia gigantea]|uniref:START domain-containing protein n=1 Tax=Lottia gigantea TaxID=225164 RepID=V4BCS2_LOTGI|nr:hypothetical protein LOTGIDRAFT_102899 [Lottia gigantea]ESP05526.1 hypothetical protein LOTGIDRAFT_102899 [Lottia gigantea]
MDFREIAEKTADILKGYLKDDSGWEVAKKTKDILIEYKPSKEFGGHLYRGTSEYSCPVEIVFQYVDPLPGDAPRLKWDKGIKKIEILKTISDDVRINRVCTDSACMGMISPRDFVDVILNKKTEDGMSTNVSIDYAECPVDKKYVRGWNHHCGLICMNIPDKPGHTKLVSLIQPDIKGMLPRALVDQAIPGSMTEFFANLRQCLKDDGKLQ